MSDRYGLGRCGLCVQGTIDDAAAAKEHEPLSCALGTLVTVGATELRLELGAVCVPRMRATLG